ncbi:hypothetical protein [Actinomycetospora straminea]|nr:hypothetical protein [Actinomycetospora straminea]MDD7934348.1 hypothetical protein [Actinomycetospora straminea]
MGDALSTLQEPINSADWLRVVLPRLVQVSTDSFFFHKESTAPSGLISWRDGEDLVRSSRATLIAGAKTYLGQLKRFSNKFGHFAGRYLDTVLMGQTAPGSYVVTAHAPAQAAIPISSSKSETKTALPSLEVASGRDVTSSIARALESTEDALFEARKSNDVGAFDNRVSTGVSYDLLTALQGVTKDSDGAEIRLEWDVDADVGESRLLKVEFRGSDSTILERAAARLSVAEESTPAYIVVGRVHLLTRKEVGGPGVFGIDSIGAGGRKFRVRLADADEYHEAVRAHEEEIALRVSGRLEREANISWLYDATIIGTAGPASGARGGRGASEPLDNQMTLDDTLADESTGS